MKNGKSCEHSIRVYEDRCNKSLQCKFNTKSVYVVGLTGVAKVLIAMERRMLPANLHYTSPNRNVPALLDGRLHVVSENTAWSGGYVGVNSFGFGGSNVHVLLKSPNQQRSSVPAPDSDENGLRLFTLSGRTKEVTLAVLNDMHKYAAA